MDWQASSRISERRFVEMRLFWIEAWSSQSIEIVELSDFLYVWMFLPIDSASIDANLGRPYMYG